jgi:hypothetical protein
MSRGHGSHSGLRSVGRWGLEKSSPSNASFFSVVSSKCSFKLQGKPWAMPSLAGTLAQEALGPTGKTQEAKRNQTNGRGAETRLPGISPSVCLF